MLLYAASPSEKHRADAAACQPGPKACSFRAKLALSSCWCCMHMHKVWRACALQLKKCVSLAPLSQQHMQLAASLAVHNMLRASGQWHSCPGPGSLLSADPLRAAPGVMCSCTHLDVTVVVQAPGLVLLAVGAGAVLVLACRIVSCVSHRVCCGVRQGCVVLHPKLLASNLVRHLQQ